MTGHEARLTMRGRGDGVVRRHAVVVGIDDYADRALHLPFCARDAIRIAEVLAAHGYQVTALHDGPGRAPAPTLARVTAAIAKVTAAADEDDLIAVYVSCHGRLLGGRPHLLMADTPNTDDGLATRGLPLSTLLAGLRGRARWVAIFLDACHMGLGLDPSASESAGLSAERAGGFALLSGSTSGQITQDTTGAGIFSQALHEGLAGAAADPDGAVRFSALARHVQGAVTRWRASPEGKLKLSSQTPVLRLEVADLELFPAHDYRDLQPALPAKIRAAAFSPDGRRLVTACEDCSVRLWDPDTRAQVLPTMWHEGHVGGVAFSSDGLLIASASNDGSTRVWQAPGASEVGPAPARENTLINAVAWAPDRRAWAAAAHDGLRVYQADAIGRAIGTRGLLGHDGPVWAVAFAPDGRLISGGTDGTVRTWNIDSGACEQVWQHEGPVWAVAVSPDGALVAAAGTDATVGPTLVNEPRLWRRATARVVRRLPGHGGGVTAIAFAPGGDRLATTCYDGRARLFVVDDGRLLRELTVAVDGHGHRPEAYAAAFAPDGKRLFVGYADGRGRLFKL